MLRTISARTGYPIEMLQPGLDLEADLSIDSIKRTEIVGELVSVLGAAGSVDDLAQLKTIEGIVGWFGAAPAAPAQDVRAVVLQTISTRTGYPIEMLQPGLDLEADLSIDSIKRTEIVARAGGRARRATSTSWPQLKTWKSSSSGLASRSDDGDRLATARQRAGWSASCRRSRPRNRPNPSTSPAGPC